MEISSVIALAGVVGKQWVTVRWRDGHCKLDRLFNRRWPDLGLMGLLFGLDVQKLDLITSDDCLWWWIVKWLLLLLLQAVGNSIEVFNVRDLHLFYQLITLRCTDESLVIKSFALGCKVLRQSFFKQKHTLLLYHLTLMVINNLHAFITLSRWYITSIGVHVVIYQSLLVSDRLAVLLELRDPFRQGQVSSPNKSLVNLVGRLLLSTGENSAN